MPKQDVFTLAEKDVPLSLQAHVNGHLARIRSACVERMKTGPAGATDAAWKSVPANCDFFTFEGPAPEGMGTAFRVAMDKEAIYFLIECPEPKMSELRDKTSAYDPRDFMPPRYRDPGTPPMPPVWGDDCVEVFIDPENEHHGYYRFCLSHTNMAECTYHKVFVVGWRSDIQPRSVKLDLIWDHEIKKQRNKWLAYFRVPLASMRIDPLKLQNTWGLNVMRNRTPKPYTQSRWNQTFSGTHFPLNSGALYLRKPEVLVNRVTFGAEGEWQVRLSPENELTLTLENKARKAFSGSLELTVFQGARRQEKRFFNSRNRISVPGGKEETVTLPFPLHFLERKHNRVQLTIEDGKRRQAYSGSYRIGDEGLRSHMDYVRGEIPKNPRPWQQDFYAKKVEYIIKKQPRFIRKTTAQGAPSDFYLEAHDGSVAFNLMEAGTLQKIADYLYELYDDDNDRLAGVVHFTNQRDVINYSHGNNELAGVMSPLSILRVGGAICSTYSAAVLGICQKMKCEKTGKPYEGWMISLPGHVMTVVLLDGREVLLDGSAGKFYYHWDNRLLAGPADLCEDNGLVERAGNGLTQYFPSMDKHRCYLPPVSAVWPNGAPFE